MKTLVAVFLLVPALLGAAEPPPNIVILFADDLGYGDLSCYGAAKIRTPNLDRLAEGGTRYTSYYSAASVCTPSRAGLLTGRYPARSGLNYVLFPGSTGGIRDPETTLAELLKSRGYATACIGKWHLGHLPAFHPNRHGFDHYFGLPYSNDMAPAPLYRNGDVVEEHPVDQSTLTKRYTEEAIAFMERSKEKPFLLYVPYTMPHCPIHASEPFKGKSAGGLYGDVVEELDWSVGEVVKALDRLKLRERTLVLFTSDNGPWLIKKEHGGSAGPLREGKGTPFEGGFREPCIASWPGKVPAGRVSDIPWRALDVLPTAAALAGATLPEGVVIDGRDARPVLFGEAPAAQDPGKEFVFYYYGGETLFAVRAGHWKLLVRGRGARRGPPPPLLDPPELYDLEADIGEKTSVSEKHPEVVARLKKLADDFQAGFKPPPSER